MADRGRLFYASDGLLWEVDPTADISGEPAQADLQPVRMGEMAAEVMELDQQADDGTDRVFIRGSDGAIKAEVFFDGMNTVINPLTGNIDVQGALATDQADITNETLIVAKTDASVSIGSANTWTSPSFGTEDKDERNEFSSDQFTPDQGGFYLISAHARFDSTDMSSGDAIEGRIQNVTDGSTVVQGPRRTIGSTNSAQSVFLTAIEELTASKAYEFQMRNFNSATDISATGGAFYARSALRDV